MQGHVGSVSDEVSEVKMLLQNEINLRKAAEEEINILRNQLAGFMPSEVWFDLSTEIICASDIGCFISIPQT